MADFNVELVKQNLGVIKDVFENLKTPLGNEKSEKINKAIKDATDNLANGLTNTEIQEILQKFDSDIDGVAGNNIINNFSNFNFADRLETSKTLISSKLPSVSANLNLNWSLNSNQGTATLDKFELGSLLGENSFLGGVLSNVDSALKPVDTIIKGLTKNIPFITEDIPNGLGIKKSNIDLNKDDPVSILALLQFANNEALKDPKLEKYTIKGLDQISSFISEAGKLVTFTGQVKKASNVGISLPGSFDFNIEKKQFLGSTLLQGSMLSDDLQKTLDGLTNFTLPVLQTQTAAKLFFGETNVELFEYKMPQVSLITSPGFAEAVKIPIIVPALKITFGPTIGGSIALGFGYDTTGFYIKDVNGTEKPELEFSGEFRVGVELGDEGIAEIQGGGNIGLKAGFSIKADDPKDKDKARTFKFTTSGSAYAYLDASASIDALGAGTAYLEAQLDAAKAVSGYFSKITKDAGVLGDGAKIVDKAVGKVVSFFKENKPKAPSAVLFKVETEPLELWEFGSSNNNSGGEPTQPILATLSGDVLFLNIGTRAGERKIGNITDGSETFSVRQTDTQLLVSAFGLEQAYLIPETNKIKDFIIADGGLENDIITINTNISANVKGGKGDDKIYGSSVDDILAGGDNNDILEGRNGNDFLLGEAGDDTLRGGNGKDFLYGGTGNDILEGGNEDDELFGNEGTDTLVGGDGNDLLDGGDDKDIMYGDAGEDTLYGGRGDDEMYGGSQKDILFGEAGSDTLRGGDDSDLLAGEAGADVLYGGAGDDSLYGGTENDKLFGEQGDDVLYGDAGEDTLYGGEDNDEMYGGSQQDLLFGEAGDDLLLGEADNDLIDGGTEVDTVSYNSSPSGVVVNIDETQAYSNTAYPSDIEPTFTIASGTALDGFGSTDTLRNLENIIGSAYDDILIGNALKNTLNGLNGNDLLIGNGGDDILDGGNGIDTVSYRRSVNSSNIGVSVDLSIGVGFDGIDGLDTLINIENLIGSQFADRLTGSNQANTILGGDGNDIIDGKEGNDRLFGENGQDEIFGGNGNDYLVGGTGADLLDGGEGNDTASYITSTAGILASLVTKTGAFADAQGDRFISIENLEGSEYDDFLYGDENDNILSGLGGNDTIRGEAGDDRLDGGTGDNLLNAGEGNNTIVAADGKNTVYAESGNDSVLLGNGNNTVFAGKGNNSVVVGNGDNTVYAESGNDSIVVGNGNNTVFAGDGINTITAGSGNDTLYGGAGTDVIDAGAGNNTVFAYDCQNIVLTQDGNDIIYGGAGRDFISAGGGNDTIFAGDGDNWIAAGTGNNLIYSGSGKNLFILEAGTGFNTIKNFAIGKDKLGLTAGLQPEQLTISQVNSDGFFGAQISIAGSGDVLARLEWTSANQLTASSFTPNLPLANSSLISLFG